ncbi:ribulose-5-phosphate 3-epimerase [Raineyella antarctica]|uniref:Ribulose-phosphate 3-epimerase n=1 Tax=Raineyella antarctica TaxID=1577474 RepID=A0A1G6HHZ8_9ACTN|nr:ribulose-phosphate 3-epimerase [Raineyella antarctica]SDB93947.1 ribulose-5-phosphate 3-epimerase [Raineyella antarctica]
MGIQITPSILSADFTNLDRDIAAVPSADAIHIDVMDNHFVPNLTIGLPVVEAIRKRTTHELDIHLMITDPDRWAPEYAEAGAESVSFHVEAAAAPVRLARELRSMGCKAALGIKPATPIEPYADLLGEFDKILIMTVEPGFGGQSFLDIMMPKVRRTRELIRGTGLEIALQVDGGISERTIDIAIAAGADVFVAGSAVYGADDPDAMIRALREHGDAELHQNHAH